jgi:hypothetical protein
VALHHVALPRTALTDLVTVDDSSCVVGVLELQKRGALHSHLALGYTTDAERIFARSFIESLKKWSPLCGLGFVDGWQHAERKSLYGH